MIGVGDPGMALPYGPGTHARKPFEKSKELDRLAFLGLGEPKGRAGSPVPEVRIHLRPGPEDPWEERTVDPSQADQRQALREWVRGRMLIAADSPRLQLLLGEAMPARGPDRLALEDWTGLFGAPEENSAAGVPSTLDRACRAVRQVLARGPARLAVLAHTFGLARAALEREDAAAAHHLSLFLSLLEFPAGVFDAPDLHDGALSGALASFPRIEDALEAVAPRWTIRRDGESPLEPLGVLASEELLLDEPDRARVDAIFREHLPAVMAESARYREGQHGVAACIAAGFGRRELRLIYAPTGTGKTLAYLVPAMIWALRNGIRVGVATFTRTLQEQAMEREVPLAKALLRRAGISSEVRVTVLKGRSNYLCWRAFVLQVPALDEGGIEQLAWACLADFAMRDEVGDLDRRSRVRPLHLLDETDWNAADQRLLRLVRADSGCCGFTRDRQTCGAHAARHRAERAHVVIANHSFALARREFFKHLVFDECEHLHDVAQNAFSHTVGLRSLRKLLGRFYGSESKRPLNRIASLTPPESETGILCRTAIEALFRASEATIDLNDALASFKSWRRDRQRARTDRDHHSLFREYVLEDKDAIDLITAHEVLSSNLVQLAATCAQMSEVLETSIPVRELSRLRRTLEVLRLELEEVAAGVNAWIPRTDKGVPRFHDETFYDAESTPMGEDVLAARVLLPHEFLGRRYLSDLGGAVLLSATTWLKNGFEASATFLGVTRAADPAPEEEREPTQVETFRAPEAFDYSRVCVCVPRDVPAVHDKEAFLEFTVHFLEQLGERTGGRILALFTNADDLARTGRALEPFFEARGIPFWWQRMSGTSKEELSELFRKERNSVLLGLDTFWYGADFPGETVEYLVLVRLPYGVPDRYHNAQCAALGRANQRRQVYMPRALAKFRQGFGRLMRRETDRGAVFCLDKRLLDPRHRAFLKELPVRSSFDKTGDGGADASRSATLIVGDSSSCLDRAVLHMERVKS
ncbi:MAG: hypothetical protein CMJ89_12785 [Planctomycetes bacterium]|nr:hypothetical protein [Planctomycetota bacterium]